MTKIIRLNNDYWVNLDDHCLYFKEEKRVKMNRRPLEVLEFLSGNPNCYKSCEEIAKYLTNLDNKDTKDERNPSDEGFISDEAIRRYVHDLRAYDPVFREVLPIGRGYIFVGEKNEKIEMVSNGNNSEQLASMVKEFLDETNVTYESDISLFSDDKRVTRILFLARKIKEQLNDSNPAFKTLEGLIDERIDCYNEFVETCLCLRDCGEYLGQNTLNEYVVENLHFLDYFCRYAQKAGYDVKVKDCIGDINKTIDLFIKVIGSPEGTEKFIHGLFYGPDRLVLQMKEEIEKILEALQKYVSNEKS